MRRISLGVLVLPTLLFAQSVSFLTGPEVPLTPVSHGGATGFRGPTAVASNGEDFFVSWFDGRGACGIYGTRVTASGEVLDPLGIPLSNECVGETEPSVLWAGENYLATWRYLYGTGAGRRVRADGSILDPEPFVLDGPRITATESTILMLGGREGRGLLLDQEGKVLHRLSESAVGGVSAGFTGVGASANQYAVVASSVQGPEGAIRMLLNLFDDQGEAVFSEPKEIYTSSGYVMWSPKVAWTGNEWIVVWTEFQLDYTADVKVSDSRILMLRVNGKGEVIGEIVTIHHGKPFTHQIPAAVVLNSGIVVVMWATQSDGEYFWHKRPDVVLAKRVNGADIVDAEPVRLPTPPGSVATNGERILVAHVEFPASPPGVPGAGLVIRATLLDASLRFITTKELSKAAIAQDEIAAVSSDDSTLALWVESSAEITQHLMTAPLARDGRIRATPRRVHTAPVPQHRPVVATNGHLYLAVWYQGFDPERLPAELLAMRLSPQGEPLDTAPIVIGRGFRDAAVAWNGEQFLVAWTDESRQIRLTEILPSGVALNPGRHLLPSLYRDVWPGQVEPAIACSGPECVVVWREGTVPVQCYILCPSPPPPAKLRGVLLDAGGRVADPAGIDFGEQRVRLRPAIAWNGTQYLLAWTAGGESGPDITSIGAARLSRNGSVLHPEFHVGLPTEPWPPAARPSVGGWKEGFAIAWAVQDGTRYEPIRSIESIVVTNAGEVSNRIPISSSPHDEAAPAVVSFPDQQVLVFYRRAATEAVYAGSNRIFSRFIASSARRRVVTRP